MAELQTHCRKAACGGSIPGPSKPCAGAVDQGSDEGGECKNYASFLAIVHSPREEDGYVGSRQRQQDVEQESYYQDDYGGSQANLGAGTTDGQVNTSARSSVLLHAIAK